MKKIILVLVIVLVAGRGFGNPLQFMWGQDDEWILMDTIMESTFCTLILVDWKQTDWAMQQRETRISQEYPHHEYEGYKYKETNLILGEHPSRKKIAIYNISWLVAHPVIFPEYKLFKTEKPTIAPEKRNR